MVNRLSQEKSVLNVDEQKQRVTPTMQEQDDRLTIHNDILGSSSTDVKEEAVKSKTVEESVQPEQSKSERPEETPSMEEFENMMISLKPGQIVRGTILKITPEEVMVSLPYKSDGVLPVSELTLIDPCTGEARWHEGDPIDVEVVRLDDEEGNVVLARKSLEKRLAWEELEEGFKCGREYKGICTEVVKGGVLADVNGIKVFVPASQLSTRYVEDLNSLVGKPLRLKIIELERRGNRVVASQKVVLQAEEEARKKALWDNIKEGQIITGKVKNLTDYGVFVDIGGVDGLIHVSDLSWGHVDHPSKVVQENQSITVKVLSVDKEKGRIALGYKQTFPQPWDNVAQKYQVGDTVAGRVVRLTHFGAFVELEPGIDGLVHVSEIAEGHVNKPADVLQVGQAVNVKILDIKPEQRKISLSIKEALREQEEKEAAQAEKGYQSDEEGLSVNLGEFFPDKFKPRRLR